MKIVIPPILQPLLGPPEIPYPRHPWLHYFAPFTETACRTCGECTQHPPGTPEHTRFINTHQHCIPKELLDD